MKNEQCGRKKAALGDAAMLDAPRAARAFTLIELLVVLAVIAAMAALTFPAIRGAKISMLRARARTQMLGLQSAIERYRDKLGHYPPDNGTNYVVNQLYYELMGTTNSSGVYHTLDDSAQIPATTAAFQAAFGASTPITGFMNCARGGDDVPSGQSFLRDLKPSQFLALDSPRCTVLGDSLDGPLMLQNAAGIKINPWRYNSSNPRYNTKTFDLWIDVIAGSKTNRICNWSDKPLVIYEP